MTQPPKYNCSMCIHVCIFLSPPHLCIALPAFSLPVCTPPFPLLPPPPCTYSSPCSPTHFYPWGVCTGTFFLALWFRETSICMTFMLMCVCKKMSWMHVSRGSPSFVPRGKGINDFTLISESSSSLCTLQ